MNAKYLLIQTAKRNFVEQCQSQYEKDSEYKFGAILEFCYEMYDYIDNLGIYKEYGIDNNRKNMKNLANWIVENQSIPII